MTKLTNQEREALELFEDGDWHKVMYWLVDYLACRGLLQRLEPVHDRIKRPLTGVQTGGYLKAIEDHNRVIYIHRAATCSYRLTQRGRKALGQRKSLAVQS